jgi:predicted DNA-binding protein
MERLTERVTVKVSPRLAARLRATARKRQKTRSAIVREALERRLSREKLTPYELVMDLVGSIEGPPDLSTRDPFAELRRKYNRSQAAAKARTTRGASHQTKSKK